jgi:hypothetical protein
MGYPGPQLADDQSFRILQLQPGSFNDPVRFSLELTISSETNSQPKYEAISYAWADLTLTHEIQYEDFAMNNFGSLMVTTNCHNALKNLRLLDRPRPLWLDAVCINQENINERSAQIQMMRTIYSGAGQVVVYLGESADDSDSVMQWLSNLDEPIDYPRTEINILLPSDEACQRFFTRPWFQRTWILQEVINAQSVEIQCGNMVIPWKALRAYDDYEINSYRPLSLPEAVVLVSELRGGSDFWDPDFMLLRTLKRTRNCLSSDPRDKLYAILPLLGLTDLVSPLRPDYQRSTIQVFTDLALHLYEKNDADVLREACTIHNQGMVNMLPSWTPDWTPTQESKPMRYKQFNAGGKLIENAQLQRGSIGLGQYIRQLHLRGVCVGTPTRISDECDVKKNIFPLSQWQGMARASSAAVAEKAVSPSSPSQPDKLDDFELLITHERIVYPEALLRGIKLILDWEKDKSSTTLLKDIPKRLPASYDRQLERVLKCCDQCKLVIFDNGLMGLVPAYTKVSDVVYVIPGATVPFVFRKQDGHYLLVGECYVQGIMDGEACIDVDISSMEQLVLE